MKKFQNMSMAIKLESRAGKVEGVLAYAAQILCWNLSPQEALSEVVCEFREWKGAEGFYFIRRDERQLSREIETSVGSKTGQDRILPRCPKLWIGCAA
jgi:hypothetical protein